MADFLKAYRITREHEGGYHNASGINSADRGGETFKGVARKFHGTWAGWTEIDKLKREPSFPKNAENNPVLNSMVIAFYKKNFWDVNKMDEIQNQAIANEIFDTGVNMGVKTAALFLQRTLNYLNRNQKSYKNINVDGIIGRITVGLVNGLSANDQIDVFNTLNILQGQRYLEIMDRDPAQQDFFRGWLTRVETLKKSW